MVFRKIRNQDWRDWILQLADCFPWHAYELTVVVYTGLGSRRQGTATILLQRPNILRQQR